jgi:beta-lactamase superfamily II metal-dependent hydrolase
MEQPLRIRMYRQGLGDCFLLTIPDGTAQAHVLIDCGVLKGTANATATMQRVVENIRHTTNGRLDVLVVTHEHWDHVSGFLQARDQFKDIEIGVVWLAWTEKPGDDIARELQIRRARVLRAVATAAGQLEGMAAAGAQRTARRLNGLLSFYGDLAATGGRPTTRQAMEWAKARPSVEFLFPAQKTLAVPGVSNVRVYVLGPPRDAAAIRKSRPSKTASEVYHLAGDDSVDLGFLAAVEQMAGDGGGAESPFERWFHIPTTAAAEHPFFAEHYLHAEHEWRNIEGDWLGGAERLALHLDSDTNNTSLALAFELTRSRRVLLFPGDAQVGNWLSWAPLTWTIHEGQETRTVTGKDLLARTVLYKVGHHGSHNATLRDQGLELMTSDELAALIPVNRETARRMDWNMPFPSLLTRLMEKTKGRILDRDTGVPQHNPGALSNEQWQQFIDRTAGTQDWLDYFVEV